MRRIFDSNIPAEAVYEWDEGDYAIAEDVYRRRKEVNESRGRTWRVHHGRSSDEAHIGGYLAEMAFGQFLQDLGYEEDRDFVQAPAVLPDAHDASEDFTIFGDDVDVKSLFARDHENLLEVINRWRSEGFRINAKKSNNVREHPPFYAMVTVDRAARRVAILGFARREDVLREAPQPVPPRNIMNHVMPVNTWMPIEAELARLKAAKR